jgi:hypothetical protein
VLQALELSLLVTSLSAHLVLGSHLILYHLFNKFSTIFVEVDRDVSVEVTERC